MQSYSNTDLETLFVGWFEQEDESKKAELLRIVEIELLPDKQIRYVVESIVREAITKNPRWKFSPPISPPLSEEEMAILEILMELCQQAGTAKRDIENREIFSEDEQAYIRFILEWKGDSRPTDAQVEEALGWYQSKAHRVKKSIKEKIRSLLDKI